MKLDNFLQLFTVKEKKFFPLFSKQAELIVKASSYLVEITKEVDPDNRNIISHRIKELESACDTVTDNILDEVQVAFVTPFDREDIHRLASMMDTFLDLIHDSAKKFSIYQPKDTEQKLIDIAQIIYNDAVLIQNATDMFEGLRKKTAQVSDICDRIKVDEHTVDDIYEAFMSHIFQNEKDLVELVKKKNIVQALEDTSDHVKTLSEAIRTVIVKMS